MLRSKHQARKALLNPDGLAYAGRTTAATRGKGAGPPLSSAVSTTLSSNVGLPYHLASAAAAGIYGGGGSGRQRGSLAAPTHGASVPSQRSSPLPVTRPSYPQVSMQGR